MRFFIFVLGAFFARVKPVSTIVKPACMKKTRLAAAIDHTRFRFFCISGASGIFSANAGPAVIKICINSKNRINLIMNLMVVLCSVLIVGGGLRPPPNENAVFASLLDTNNAYIEYPDSPC